MPGTGNELNVAKLAIVCVVGRNQHWHPLAWLLFATLATVTLSPDIPVILTVSLLFAGKVIKLTIEAPTESPIITPPGSVYVVLETENVELAPAVIADVADATNVGGPCHSQSGSDRCTALESMRR